MAVELGYNTNGFAHHRLADAIEVIAETGYQSVALTLDLHALNPYDDDLPAQVREVRGLLERLNLCCVIETGSRFLLDSRRKHQPTLLSPREEDRRRRLDFLIRAVQIAVELDAEAVSFWSGRADPGQVNSDLWGRLVEGCDHMLTVAVRYDMRLAFEPEPAMFVERMDQYAELARQLSHPRFGLTLDVGHLHCLNDGRPADRIREFRRQLFNVHLDDARRGVHDHLMFGEGEIEFPPVFEALEEIGYTGSVNVELSRHSHDAVRTAQKAFGFLAHLNRS
jgi:L-ribulose-5-phosphate 3-epimerase